MFKWIEFIVVYSEWHEIYDKYKHLTNVFFHKETGKSVYEAWSQAAELASTKYCINWNIDDRFYPKAIEKKFIVLEKNPDIGLVYNWTNVTNIENDDPSDAKGIWRQFRWLSPDDPNWDKQCNGGPDPMWRKELYDQTGPFNGKEYPVAADWDKWMSFKKLAGIHLITQPLCLYFLNPVGVSTSENGRKRNAIDDQKILKKYEVV